MSLSRVGRNFLHKTLLYFYVAVLLAFLLFPILWMFSLAFTPRDELMLTTAILPTRPTLQNFYRLFEYTHYLRYLTNSLLVSLTSMLTTVIIATFAGYALARIRFRGKSLYSSFLILTQMLPGMLFVIPLYWIMIALGLFDTYYVLILCYVAFATPFCTWLMKGYIETIPQEIEEAGLIDGCNMLNLFFRVVFPVILPGAVAVAIFAFIAAWGEFLFAFTLTQSASMRTLPIGLAALFGETSVEWELVMAGAAMYSLPVLVLFSYIQRYLVKGLAAGAVKM